MNLKENRKKDRKRPLLPDAIRYFFYEDVLSHFGVPKQPPRHCSAWSTANIDATLIV
jgi:hypothetical protein